MIDNNIYTENSIRTFTGKVFDLKILDPESICIEDIAHALAHTPRFGGHLEKHYSVAQHCVFIAWHCSKENKLAGLLHDASEAYISDMPSPFKKMMPEYKKIEERLMRVIAQKFGFSMPLPEEVKDLDREYLDREWKCLVLKANTNVTYWTAEEAKEKFLELYRTITADEVCLQKCESCEKETDINIMTTDSEDNWFCPECWEVLAPVMKDEYDELVKRGEIEPEHQGTTANIILLDELNENNHPERVEDVIFWALEHYAKRGKGTNGEMIAYAIKQRILDEEEEDHNRAVDNLIKD